MGKILLIILGVLFALGLMVYIWPVALPVAIGFLIWWIVRCHKKNKQEEFNKKEALYKLSTETAQAEDGLSEEKNSSEDVENNNCKVTEYNSELCEFIMEEDFNRKMQTLVWTRRFYQRPRYAFASG